MEMNMNMKTPIILALSLLLAANAFASAEGIQFAPANPNVKFNTEEFDRLEKDFPISDEALAKLTAEDLTQMNQNQLDQLYAHLSAGDATLDGFYRGHAYFAKFSYPPFTLLNRLPLLVSLQQLMESLWGGKVFFAEEGILRNRIFNAETVVPLLARGPYKLGKNFAYSGNADGKDFNLMFPAKVYVGESLFDTRRPSIIIDYAKGSEIAGYQENIDYLAGPSKKGQYVGLQIRDEIRMVHPGLYLGRAYSYNALLVNFTLEKP